MLKIRDFCVKHVNIQLTTKCSKKGYHEKWKKETFGKFLPLETSFSNFNILGSHLCMLPIFKSA